ncbi:MAG: zinc-binding alcohol dehydrogenase family protein [Anaerolineae bacterium]|nr:zinc-binding alcohol dehydrogenase family protein [Anaerolineae bacterium]
MGPEDVLLELQYVGLCGSDLNAYRGSFALVTYPLIPGHELSTVVLDKGCQVPDSLQAGDKVTVLPYTQCDVCPACRAGRPNCCQFNQTLGVQRPGALCERIAVPYTKLYKSDLLTQQELALVEPMSVGYHAANRGQVSEMDDVLAIGCGTIGIGVVAAAARKGAKVIAVDIDDDKLALAKEFGAQYTINSIDQDVLEAVAQLTNGEGVNVAIEAVGLPQTFRIAIEAVCYAGRVVYVGYAKRDVTFDTTDFVRKELDIRGSRNALRVFPAVIKMIEQRAWPFSKLISRTYPFDLAGQALADWDADPGRFTKILIACGDG